MIIGLLYIAFFSNDMLAAGGRKRASASGGSSFTQNGFDPENIRVCEKISQWSTPASSKKLKPSDWIHDSLIHETFKMMQRTNHSLIEIQSKLRAAASHQVEGIVKANETIIIKNYAEMLDFMFMHKKDKPFFNIWRLKPYDPKVVESYLKQIITQPTHNIEPGHQNIFKGLLDRLDLKQNTISLSILELAIDKNKPELLQKLIKTMRRESIIMNADLGIPLIIRSFEKYNSTCLNIILQQGIETRDWTDDLLQTHLVAYLSNDSDTNHPDLIAQLKAHESQLPARLPARPQAACKSSSQVSTTRLSAACKSSQVSTTSLSKKVEPCIKQLNDKLKSKDFQEDEFIAYLQKNIKEIKKIPHNEKIKISKLIIRNKSLDSYKLLCEQCDFCMQTADDTKQLFQAIFQIPHDDMGLDAQEFLEYFMSIAYPINVKMIVADNHLPIVAYLLCRHQTYQQIFPDTLLDALISHGFDINQALPNTLATPLHLAISLGNKSINIAFDQLMKQKNLNTKAKNHKNETPCDLAIDLKKWDLVDEIKQYETLH